MDILMAHQLHNDWHIVNRFIFYQRMFSNESNISKLKFRHSSKILLLLFTLFSRYTFFSSHFFREFYLKKFQISNKKNCMGCFCFFFSFKQHRGIVLGYFPKENGKTNKFTKTAENYDSQVNGKLSQLIEK